MEIRCHIVVTMSYWGSSERLHRGELLGSYRYYSYGWLPSWWRRERGYWYGFNSKEWEWGVGDGYRLQDYGERMYMTRLGRFMSVDPLIVRDRKYLWLSPYSFAGLNPVNAVDLDGLEPVGRGYFEGQRAIAPEKGAEERELYWWKWMNKKWERIGQIGLKSSSWTEIWFKKGVRYWMVGKTTIEVLTTAMSKSKVSRVLITSSGRTVREQALAMYWMIKTKGADYARRLYAKYGDMVIDVAQQAIEQGKGKEEVINLIEAKIKEVGPRRVSRHIIGEDYSRLNVIDIAPSSIGSKLSLFIRTLREDERVKWIITPDKDPGLHVEIEQQK